MPYESNIVPNSEEETLQELLRFLGDELIRIQLAFDTLDNLELVEQHNPPVRPRDGMIALADGTNWDPGSGAGFYGRRGGTWVLLG